MIWQKQRKQKEYIEERTSLLEKNKLLGVMSMPLELFKGIAGEIIID